MNSIIVDMNEPITEFYEENETLPSETIRITFSIVDGQKMISFTSNTVREDEMTVELAYFLNQISSGQLNGDILNVLMDYANLNAESAGFINDVIDCWEATKIMQETERDFEEEPAVHPIKTFAASRIFKE